MLIAGKVMAIGTFANEQFTASEPLDERVKEGMQITFINYETGEPITPDFVGKVVMVLLEGSVQ